MEWSTSHYLQVLLKVRLFAGSLTRSSHRLPHRLLGHCSHHRHGDWITISMLHSDKFFLI